MKTHHTPNRLFALGICVLLAGCHTIQLAPHPIPVHFDNEPTLTQPTPAPHSSRHNKAKNLKERLDYILENWF